MRNIQAVIHIANKKKVRVSASLSAFTLNVNGSNSTINEWRYAEWI
jgi:hypothetical protein